MMNRSTDGLETLRDYIRWGASQFAVTGAVFGHGTDNGLDEAVTLILRALHLPLDLPDCYLDSRLTEAERDLLLALLQRRIEEKIPAAYLVGEARFAGLDFYVDENVLVPRSPIAELIEQGFEPWLGGIEPQKILDLCTGSGCIAVACALRFPDCRVDAADISDPALQLARRNVERYQLEHQVRLFRSDLFDNLPHGGYDLIVSNPPYVSRADMETLPDEYRHEPAIGLRAGEDGLTFVKRILACASSYLSTDGIIVVEVGSSAESLMACYPEVPFLWLDFERGGDGVFLLTAAQLTEYQEVFQRLPE